jgi:hypothetical protein
LIVISTGAGADTISVTTGTLVSANTAGGLTITAGAGKDTITKVGTNAASVFGVTSFVTPAGDSTTTDYDVSTAAIATVATATNSGSILSSSTTAGIVTFDDAEVFNAAIKINSGNLVDVVGYLATNTATNDTAAFVYDADGDGANDSTMVYHNGTVDSLVLLAGVTTADALITTNGAGANDLFIG